MNKIIIKLLLVSISANLAIYSMEDAPEIEYPISREDYDRLKQERNGVINYIRRTYNVTLADDQSYSFVILPPANAEKPKRDESAISLYLRQLRENYSALKNTHVSSESAGYCQNLLQQLRTFPENLLCDDLPGIINDRAELAKIMKQYGTEKQVQEILRARDQLILKTLENQEHIDGESRTGNCSGSC